MSLSLSSDSRLTFGAARLHEAAGTRTAWRDDALSAVIAFAACWITVFTCWMFSPDTQHVFVFPLILCGTLIGIDAVDWFRGRVGAFDPVGIVGLIGVHFFFFAPLLHVMSGWWMALVQAPDDWRPWLSYMGWINVGGLLIYRLSRQRLTAIWPPKPTRTVWQIDARRFVPACLMAMAASFAMQLLIYAKFGGISGFIAAYEETADNFIGYGHMFIVSDAFPILFMLAYAIWSKGRLNRSSWLTIAVALMTFILLKVFFGGFKGNRGHLIYGMFWALGIIHFWVRPVPRKFMVIGGLSGLIFMYAYGYYKSYGSEAIAAMRGDRVSREISEEFERTPSAVLLGDLGRSDVQAFLLYRLSPECRTSSFEPVWGETYVGAASLMIPRSFWPDRPPTKIKIGTDILFGYGVYESEFEATNAYGLAGEAMMNFGVLGAIASFLVLAIVVVWAKRWSGRLAVRDARWLIVPFVYSLGFMVLIWDSDVLIVYGLKELFVPAAVLWIGSRSLPRESSLIAGQATEGTV